MIKKKRTQGKIKTHYGMSDYYKYFKKEYGLDISNEKYNAVIGDFNEAIRNLIIEENVDYRIPHLGSTLCIRKLKRTPRIVNGKVYNPNPIDWVATNKLWSEDSEAREKKLLVRYLNNHTSGYVFRIYFKKYHLNFLNKKYYRFEACRDFDRQLGARIKDEDKDKFNAYILY
jgi:hypothetical protein